MDTTQRVAACCVSADARDRTIRLWHVPEGTLLHTFRAHNHRIYGLAWSPDGQVLASGSVDRTIKLWRMKE